MKDHYDFSDAKYANPQAAAEAFKAERNELRGELESKNKELEQQKAITEAAKFLVKVKRYKDTQPAQYQATMPIAWRKLEEAVDKLTSKQKG